jgi:hypothetical protein
VRLFFESFNVLGANKNPTRISKYEREWGENDKRMKEKRLNA